MSYDINKPALRTVKLLGRLGEKFGREYQLSVQSPAEAIRALLAICDGLREYLSDSANDFLGYTILVDNHPVSNDREELLFLHDSQVTYTLAPVVQGHKSGLGQIFAGIALIAAAYFSFGLAAVGLQGMLASTMYSIGASLVIGGLTQVLTPTPTAPKPREASENEPSYYFNGAVNTREQGQAIPKGFGRMKTGGALISLSVYPVDLA